VIRRVRLKNFRRYRDATFELDEGLNFIDGENNAGKTTLFIGIEYALFGAVPGLGPAALLHPGERQLGVELVFEGKDGGEYTLQRMHARPPRAKTRMEGHFTLKRRLPDGTSRYVLSSDFQDRLEALALALFELTGLSQRLFDAAVYLRQGQIANVLEGAPRLDIVLGVTAAVVAAEETRAMALELEKEAESLPVLAESLKGLDALRAGGEGERQALAERRGSLDARRAALTAKRDAVAQGNERLVPLRACHAALARAQRAEESAAARLTDLTRRKERLVGTRTLEAATAEVEREIADLAAARARNVEDLAAASAAIGIRREERSRLDAEAGDLRGRLRRRRALPTGEGARCEACGTVIDAALHACEMEAWEAELAALDAAREALGRVIEEAEARRSKIDDERAAAAVAVAQAEARQHALAGLGEEASEAATSIVQVRAEAEAERLRAAVAITAAGVTAEPEALGDALAAMERESAAARARLEAEDEALAADDDQARKTATALEARLADLDREHARVSTAVAQLGHREQLASSLRALAQGFKELQAELRDRAAAALAEDTLALHRVLSDAPDEYRALTIDEGYVVHVTPRDIGEPVPAHTHQGGGHKLLLGLAFRLALARLVGHGSFLLLDEPTYGLDEARRETLLRKIRDAGVVRQILLVTHHPLAHGEGDGARRIRVRREGDASVVASA
jgi:DNA repair exonuclease SbcCD ATPase subunit